MRRMSDLAGLLREHPPFVDAFLALLGAIAGSFASAAVYRIPREGTSLLNPKRSHCPACGARIRWHDNLPLVSWLVLRGRCRDCRQPFGAGYLVHEIGLAVLFVAAGRSWAALEGPVALGVVLVALTGLWIAAAIDFRHLILPDGITLGGIPAGFAASALVPALHFRAAGDRIPWGASLFGLGPEDPHVLVALASAAVGCVGAWAGMMAIRVVFSRLLGQEAMGLGDVKYLAAVGAWLGLEGAVLTLLIGVFAGAILGVLNVVRMIVVVAARRRRRGSRLSYTHTPWFVGWLAGRTIPFGPPLILGTILVLLAPDRVHAWVLEAWPRLAAGR